MTVSLSLALSLASTFDVSSCQPCLTRRCRPFLARFTFWLWRPLLPALGGVWAARDALHASYFRAPGPWYALHALYAGQPGVTLQASYSLQPVVCSSCFVLRAPGPWYALHALYAGQPGVCSSCFVLPAARGMLFMLRTSWHLARGMLFMLRIPGTWPFVRLRLVLPGCSLVPLFSSGRPGPCYFSCLPLPGTWPWLMLITSGTWPWYPARGTLSCLLLPGNCCPWYALMLSSPGHLYFRHVIRDALMLCTSPRGTPSCIVLLCHGTPSCFVLLGTWARGTLSCFVLLSPGPLSLARGAFTFFCGTPPVSTVCGRGQRCYQTL